MMQETAITPALGKPKEQAGLLKTQKTGGGALRSLGVGLRGGCAGRLGRDHWRAAPWAWFCRC